MKSYKDFEIEQFIIESLDGSKSIDATQCVTFVKYYEDLFSPRIKITMRLVNTEGLLTSLPVVGGERIRLVISQQATGEKIECLDEKNTYYIYKVYGSTSESTREVFFIDLSPIEMFKNETSRVFKRYPKSQGKEQKISESVKDILNDITEPNRIAEIEETKNTYAFYGNYKRPFTVINWLQPKSIPVISESSAEKGTSGFLFYENGNGYNFKSVDSLISGTSSGNSDSNSYETYYYTENITEYASVDNNFKIVTMPTFNYNADILENLISGMYCSLNFFFDLNTKKFNYYKYKLSDNYLNSFKHSGSLKNIPKIPEGLEDSPSRVMVRFIDDVVKETISSVPGTKIDDRIHYQSQSVTRYALAFSQSLNITIPLNMSLKVGDVIRLKIGQINRQNVTEKDNIKSGLYLIKALSHEFSPDNALRGLTGMILVRDSYGDV